VSPVTHAIAIVLSLPAPARVGETLFDAEAGGSICAVSRRVS